jgi:hypothetical protein
MEPARESAHAEGVGIHMHIHADVLRGVRLAAFGFALVLIGTVGSRMIHVVPGEPKPAPSPQSAAEIPQLSPDQSIPSPNKIAPSTIPDPPSPPGRARENSHQAGTLRPPTARQPVAKANVKILTSPLQPQDLPVVAPPSAAIAAIEERKANPETFVPRATSAAVSQAAAEPDQVAPPAPEGRPKRVIKAVGRFLHIGGKKDVEPDNARPKPN